MSSAYIYCPHCQEDVSVRTFRKHKQFHFSEETNSWKTIADYENESNSPVKKPRICPVDRTYQEHEDRTPPPIHTDYNDSDESAKDGDSLNDVKMDPISKYVNMKVGEIWDDITCEDITDDIGSLTTTSATNSPIEQGGTLAEISRWMILFIGAWSTAYNIPMTAIGYLLLFLNALFSACALFSSLFFSLANVIPKSVYALRKAQGLLEDRFTKYVVCAKCSTLYQLSDIMQKNKQIPTCTNVPFPDHPQRRFRSPCGEKLLKEVILKEEKRERMQKNKQIPTCTNVPFPDHPQRRFRSPCGEKLLKEVILKEEKRVLYPVKTYCYKIIISSLKCMLDRRGFKQMAESWRSRKRVPGTFRDVYDGRVWREFQSKDSNRFLRYQDDMASR